MPHGGTYLSTGLVAGLMLSACNIKTPATATGASVQRFGANATVTCPVAPTPLPSPWPKFALALDGIDGVPGFGMNAGGSGGTPQVARLKVKAYPGSDEMTINRADVHYVWPADGATRDVDAGTLPLSPVIVPPAPQSLYQHASRTTGYGAPVDVAVPLPTRVLERALAGRVPPSIVQARITFGQPDNLPVVDENHATWTARVDLPLGIEAVPSVPDSRSSPPCGGLPGPHGFPMVNDGETPHVAQLESFSPPQGITVSAGAAASSTVAITLRTPGSSGEVDVASGTVTFSWTDSAGKQQQTAALYRFPPFTIPAAPEDDFGKPITLSVPLDFPGLARASHDFADVAQGFAIAHMRFTDKGGYWVQDERLQPFDVEVPIMIK